MPDRPASTSLNTHFWSDFVHFSFIFRPHPPKLPSPNPLEPVPTPPNHCRITASAGVQAPVPQCCQHPQMPDRELKHSVLVGFRSFFVHFSTPQPPPVTARSLPDHCHCRCPSFVLPPASVPDRPAPHREPPPAHRQDRVEPHERRRKAEHVHKGVRVQPDVNWTKGFFDGSRFF
jgi:hypothetical protein